MIKKLTLLCFILTLPLMAMEEDNKSLNNEQIGLRNHKSSIPNAALIDTGVSGVSSLSNIVRTLTSLTHDHSPTGYFNLAIGCAVPLWFTYRLVRNDFASDINRNASLVQMIALIEGLAVLPLIISQAPDEFHIGDAVIFAMHAVINLGIFIILLNHYRDLPQAFSKKKQ